MAAKIGRNVQWVHLNPNLIRMIIITGAAGFIGSCVAKYFKSRIKDEIVLVDDFSIKEKQVNLNAISELKCIPRTEFFDWAADKSIDAIIHIGARTDTTEFDYSIFEQLNVNYTKQIWKLCLEKKATLIYASSAATYGDGAFGYDDDHDLIDKLIPLNPYGDSKNEFDKWALHQVAPINWYGLKFFNVYGPNEYHKGRMASVIFHAYNQIESAGKLKLFRSHNENYSDGGQLRDFIYVKDICNVVWHLFSTKPKSGLYNLGTGQARTFLDLGKAVFKSLGKSENIEFIDTPVDIRDKYQYFTEAKMEKLKSTGYASEFTSLEAGVDDYVNNYLKLGATY